MPFEQLPAYEPFRLRGPAVRGGIFALTSAVLFGISTPLVQLFGSGTGAFATAALLYAGSAVAGVMSLSHSHSHVPDVHHAHPH